MRFTRRNGFDNFAPVSWRPEGLKPSRKTRKQYNTFRDWPDGVDGMYFLEQRPGRPAVAYHYPTNEAPYFSVAFSVSGRIVGLAGDSILEQVQDAFGELMAGWGSRQKLVDGIQVITRMLPPDTARHESWLDAQLDPGAPQDMVDDYSGLLANMVSTSFVPRDYVVIRWDRGDRFDAAAKSYGPGRIGWLQLIQEQIPLVLSRLESVYTKVSPLSGPRIAAVIRNMQHPGWAIDQASDVTPDTMYLASHAEWRWVEVGAVVPDPDLPEVLAVDATSWLHRTAQISPGDMETAPRNGLWLTPLLTGMADQVTRTVSMHIRFTPAQEAKRSARSDVVGDQADLVGMDRKGKLIDEGAEMTLAASESRLADVSNGSGHHGASWAGAITFSVPNQDGAIATATAQIEEAADACGINGLDWQDTLQAAAQSLTWPVARALSAPRRTRSARTMDWISAKTAKESL